MRCAPHSPKWRGRAAPHTNGRKQPATAPRSASCSESFPRRSPAGITASSAGFTECCITLSPRLRGRGLGRGDQPRSIPIRQILGSEAAKRALVASVAQPLADVRHAKAVVEGTCRVPVEYVEIDAAPAALDGDRSKPRDQPTADTLAA